MTFEDPKFEVVDHAPSVGRVFGNFNALDVATVLGATAGSAAWCLKGGKTFDNPYSRSKPDRVLFDQRAVSPAG